MRAARDAVVHFADHAACGGLEQARDDRVHEGCEPRAEQARRKTEREQEMFAIGFVDRLRMGQEQPLQDGLHGRAPAVWRRQILRDSDRAYVPNVTADERY